MSHPLQHINTVGSLPLGSLGFPFLMSTPNLQLFGQLHRPRYEGGGILKCLMFSECTDAGDDSGRGVQICQLLAQVVGTCVVDTNRILCPKGTFGDSLVGGGTAHGSAVLDAEGSAGKSKTGGGMWGLFGWGKRSLADGTSSNGVAEVSCSLRQQQEEAERRSMPNALLFPPTVAAGGLAGSGSRGDESHVIFSTPIIPIIENVFLRGSDTCTAAFRCELPPNLPPSYSGYCARYYYAVHVVCEYRIVEKGAAANGEAPLLRRVLRIPVRVDSLSATRVTARSPYVPTPLNTALYREGAPTPSGAFDFRPQHTFIVSSSRDALRLLSGMAPPTSDDLQCEPTSSQHHLNRPYGAASSPQLGGGGGAVSSAILRPQPQSCEVGVKAPIAAINFNGGRGANAAAVADSSLSFVQIKPNVADAGEFPVRILLWDTNVSIGDALRGVFRCSLPQPSAATASPLVCYRAVVALECIEAAPKALFRPGSVIPKESQDESAYVVAHCSTIEENEYYLSFTASQMPFSIPLTSARCQQSSRTDVVSNQWRVRIVLYFVAASNVASAVMSRGDASVVPIAERLQEVVIPLTVLPATAVVCMGPVVGSDLQ